MKRVEILLVALMGLCALTFLSACGKKDSAAAMTVNEDPYSQYPNNNGYGQYSQNACSSQMLYQYQQMMYSCNYAYSWYERQNCIYLIQSFMNQYPQVNCYGKTQNRNSRRSKTISISSENLRNKIKQMK
jgi:hypothetical protein